MGMGMLFAGALAGGAKAADEVIDQAYKREDADRVRMQGMADRKEALLWEMQQKAEWARKEEDAQADGYVRAARRGAEIGNERGARELEAASGQVPSGGEYANERITPEMIASMPPQARAVYEREMGLTDDSELQNLRDQVTAAGEVGAPGSVRKGLLESYRDAYKSDKDEKDRERKDRQEQRRADEAQQRFEQNERRMEQQFNLTQQRLAASGARGGGGGSSAKVRSTKTNADGEVIAIMSDGSTKPLGIQDQAFSKSVASMVSKMDGRQYRNLSETEKIALAKARLAGGAVGADVDDDAPAASPKTAAPQSAVKDNQAIKTVERKVGMTQMVPSGPHKGKTVVWDGKGWMLK